MPHSPASFSPSIRRLSIKRDLFAVADLIQLCFGDQMDIDGQEYLRQVVQTANDGRYFRWMPGAGEMLSYPMDGYVWEEDEKIVGNLTILPFRWKNRWIYMVVNIAVHPAYRHRGIARQLTQKSLQHIQAHNVSAAWLQVRDDNTNAIDLYLSLGFIERCRRSTWESIEPYPMSTLSPPNVTITQQQIPDWQKQKHWLINTYPEEVAWNFSFNPGRFKPGFFSSMARWLNSDEQQHWSAFSNDQLIGTAIWDPGRWSSDMLWLAIEPDDEDLAIRTLLPNVRRAHHKKERPLCVNYPAGQAKFAFENVSFRLQNTLIWMSIEFKAP